MKIEVAESMLQSWLKHIVGCEIVQSNWKPSNIWDYEEYEELVSAKNKLTQKIW
ncbi:hypothetical protein THIOSC15_2890008 [uncultured Thiomicrorhabdus sp.]